MVKQGKNTNWGKLFYFNIHINRRAYSALCIWENVLIIIKQPLADDEGGKIFSMPIPICFICVQYPTCICRLTLNQIIIVKFFYCCFLGKLYFQKHNLSRKDCGITLQVHCKHQLWFYWQMNEYIQKCILNKIIKLISIRWFIHKLLYVRAYILRNLIVSFFRTIQVFGHSLTRGFAYTVTRKLV